VLINILSCSKREYVRPEYYEHLKIRSHLLADLIRDSIVIDFMHTRYILTRFYIYIYIFFYDLHKNNYKYIIIKKMIEKYYKYM